MCERPNRESEKNSCNGCYKMKKDKRNNKYEKKRNNLYFIIIMGLILSIIFVISLASAEIKSTVCCEKTKSNFYCQNVPAEECALDARQTPTSCASTSYCKPGTCYNGGQGLCTDNTPQLVCNANNGTWSEKSPPQCGLGCCILGDQAAFVTLTRCKYLSANLGLQTNYDRSIKDESQCILKVQGQEKGACVFDFEFQRTCKFTTRDVCLGAQGVNGSSSKGEFFSGKLCSAPELGTNCGKTTKTLCIPGKDEVYFIDTCGNPTNIYDASKLNDPEYWTNVKEKTESCGAGSANSNSKSCGNCNYLQGSYCRPASKENRPSYGNNICADLNCKKTQNGKSYKHGESWCVYDDKGTKGEGDNSVGSRYYKHICINGEEVLEQCADFRQEECIEDNIETSVGPFSQAACRVNRWQDCTAQINKQDCENTDRRDCLWKEGEGIGNETISGVCLPKNTPGIKFWGGEEAKSICAQANAQCIVTFEKGVVGKEKCVGNCECLDESWQKQRAEICLALGDCGPKINWLGDLGYKPGYNVSIGKVKKS